jgi:hypothetical protein
MSIASNNIFGKDGFFWWIGVVEDRQDPMKLGRCRVRIIGYHTDDTGILPTDELPWAIPMQGITSAAISGKGETPVGPLEGTWIIGFFADGKDMQQPIMMGTMGGIPQTSAACEAQSKSNSEIASAGVLRDTQGNVVRDAQGTAVTAKPIPTLPASTPSKSITQTLGPLSQQQIQSLFDFIGNAESSSVPGGRQNYSATNSLGFLGKYQLGAAYLQTQGYLSPPPRGGARRNSELSDPSIWTGKNGCNSQEDFLANKNNVQEIAMFEGTKFNYNWATKNGILNANSEPGKVGGILSAAHLALQAAVNVNRGGDFSDGATTGSYRYQIGARAVGGDTSLPVGKAGMSEAKNSTNTDATSKNAAGPLNNPALGTPRGYADPNSVYPTCVYTSRQDTNKLATNNDDLQGTPLEQKEQNREQEIPTANEASAGAWAEPPSAFAAKYPYNHVKETESGHIVEFDDTPNAERIHIYHRTGTYVEIDREGSVSYKVVGENYNIFGRNNRIYTKGNMDVTVDGAKTLLIKNTLDVEVHGKTTINILNDADVNISGDLNLKAKNINFESQQDINFTAGNYMSHKVGGDLSYTVSGDEQHRVSGSLDMDAADINLNSGSSNPFAAVSTGLGAGFVSDIAGDAFSITKLNPLPVDIANPLNSVSKSLSTVLSGFGAASSGFNAVSNLAGVLQGGGLGSVINTLGVNGLSDILTKAGFPGVNTILSDAGLGGINIQNALSVGGFGNLNGIIQKAGLGSFDAVLKKAGVDVNQVLGNLGGELQGEVMAALDKSGILPVDALNKGEAMLSAFIKNGAQSIDYALPALVRSIGVDATEFESWSYFPDSAQLSKSFNLGNLTTRVMDQAYQFAIQKTGDLDKYDIISNLKALAVNALDPINDRYPNLQISDAYRPVSNYIAGITDNNPVTELLNIITADASTQVQTQISSLNPFNQGRAANMHFAGAASEDYYGIAQWIKNNVAYDQIRLEYTTFGSGVPWITVVHNPDGNRDVNAVDKVVTCLNGKVISNYLVDLTTV